MPSDVVISVENVGKSFKLFQSRLHTLRHIFSPRGQHYGEVLVFRGLNFEVRRGEGVGVIGHNGAGKTTLLQMICGITMPSEGRVRVRGTIAPILALGAVFDTDLPGAENAQLACAIYGLSRKQTEERMAAIQEFAGIGDYFYEPVRTYSSGMQARLAFAVCTQADADILIVDEALAVSDAAFQEKCQAFLRGFRARGGTLLFVSHGLSGMEAICDRAIWIEKGAIRAEGDFHAISSAYEASVGGKVEEQKPFSGVA